MNFDELFTKWKSEYSFNAFIRDGIVDPAHYDRPHILFILRDMNCRISSEMEADGEHGSTSADGQYPCWTVTGSIRGICPPPAARHS